MSAEVQKQVVNALDALHDLDNLHVLRLLRFLKHQGDKFFPQEVRQLVEKLDASEITGFVSGLDSSWQQRVPPEVHASVRTVVQLYQLQQVFKGLNAPQLLALHRAVDRNAGVAQVFQILSGLQRVLPSQPLANLRNVHQMYQDAGPEGDMIALSKMLGLDARSFFLTAPIRQILSLDMEEVKSLRESFAAFSAIHLALVADLLALENFDALEMRSLFVPLILDEPEAFMGGGFALGMSGEQHPMDQRDDSDHDEDEAAAQPVLRLEISEQPPVRCVYRRNLKPSPVITMHGPTPRGRNLFVAITLLRCDTMADLEASSLEGDLVERIAIGSPVSFGRVKVLVTSHQMEDTHFCLRFDLREYEEGNNRNSDFRVLHSVQSVPFMVLSHSSQLKKPQQLIPSVKEVIPSSGHVRGGTQVVVLGDNFYDSPGIRVRFDQIDVQPTYHGPRTLVCVTPPQSNIGTVSVRVCNDGRKWGDPAQGAYAYVIQADPGKEGKQPPVLLGMVPPSQDPVVLAGPPGTIGTHPTDTNDALFGDMPVFLDLANSMEGLGSLKFSTDALNFMLSHSGDHF